MPNTLYYGDNLGVMREHIPDESVDLVYLDPPFNSNASYNVLFREKTGEESPPQIRAFTDTWDWTLESERTFENEIILNADTPPSVKDMVAAFRQSLGTNAMMAYLVMMTPRLVELRRVLKPTGSIYLHCDPTAGHYLKVLMDSVFGAQNFRNQIVWRRTTSHSDARGLGRVHDTILLYNKTVSQFTWNNIYQPLDPEYVENYYRYEDSNGRKFMSADLSAAGSGPDRNFGERGIISPPEGRHWMYDAAGIEELLKNDKIYWTRNGVPRLKVYLDEHPGIPAQDVWADILPLRSWHKERLGYPIQKPQALLERIITASSNEGDVVLDPFCGCGTAVAAAHKLDRQWMGIDITHLAVALMKNRLKTGFDLLPGKNYEVVGEPVDVGSARALAEQDRFQFEYWAMSLLEALPRERGRRGADRGIDGVVHFIDGPRRTTMRAIVQVKSGRVEVSQVRDLVGTVEREDVALGLFITLENPTREMRREAAAAGFYHSDLWQRDFPKIQLLTIRELLEGREFEIPAHPSMYQPAQRAKLPEGYQGLLEDAFSG